MARFDIFARNDPVFLDDSIYDADKIKIITVHSRHFSRLSPEEGAPGFMARIGNPGKNLLIKRASQLAYPYLIQEIKRFGTLHRDVIYAVIHYVVADRVKLIHHHGHHQLCPYAVNT